VLVRKVLVRLGEADGRVAVLEEGQVVASAEEAIRSVDDLD
jgi:hypothetical protein